MAGQLNSTRNNWIIYPAMNVWLKNRIWAIAVIFWVVFCDRVAAFRSHFWFASLGAIILGLLIVGIEAVIAMRKTRTGS